MKPVKTWQKIQSLSWIYLLPYWFYVCLKPGLRAFMEAGINGTLQIVEMEYATTKVFESCLNTIDSQMKLPAYALSLSKAESTKAGHLSIQNNSYLQGKSTLIYPYMLSHAWPAMLQPPGTIMIYQLCPPPPSWIVMVQILINFDPINQIAPATVTWPLAAALWLWQPPPMGLHSLSAWSPLPSWWLWLEQLMMMMGTCSWLPWQYEGTGTQKTKNPVQDYNDSDSWLSRTCLVQSQLMTLGSL